MYGSPATLKKRTMNNAYFPNFRNFLMSWFGGAIVADRTGPLVCSLGQLLGKNLFPNPISHHITRPVLAPFCEKEIYHSWSYCTCVKQVGAPAHRGKITLAEEKPLGIIHLDWPASSPFS